MKRCSICGHKLGDSTQVCPECTQPTGNAVEQPRQDGEQHDEMIINFETGCLPILFPPFGFIGAIRGLFSRDPEERRKCGPYFGFALFGTGVWAVALAIIIGMVNHR